MKNNKNKSTTETEIRKHLALQKESGVSIKEYCDTANITKYCFYKWRQRYGEAISKKPTPNSFMPIQVQDSCVSEQVFMQVDFPNGAKVQFYQTLSTKELLTILSQVSC